MRWLATLTLSVFLVAPAGAQQLGARTATPAQLLGQMEQPASPDAEVAAIARAAAAHPFGSAANPVRVGGPDGEQAYLARLRCPDGTAPRIGAREEAGTGAYGSVVAAYAVTCAGTPAARVVIDMYHEEHVETQAPAGLTLGT